MREDCPRATPACTFRSTPLSMSHPGGVQQPWVRARVCRRREWHCVSMCVRLDRAVCAALNAHVSTRAAPLLFSRAPHPSGTVQGSCRPTAWWKESMSSARVRTTKAHSGSQVRNPRALCLVQLALQPNTCWRRCTCHALEGAPGACDCVHTYCGTPFPVLSAAARTEGWLPMCALLLYHLARLCVSILLYMDVAGCGMCTTQAGIP